jgi:hypothetical protein
MHGHPDMNGYRMLLYEKNQFSSRGGYIWKDRRFSMKMMLAPVPDHPLQPVRSVST